MWAKDVRLFWCSSRRRLGLTMYQSRRMFSPSQMAATVIVTTGNGEVRCQGTFPAQSKEAKIILNRNPRLPVYRAGFNETLGKLKGRGQMNTIWKPVGRSFEELVLVFDPSTICSLQANSLS